MTIEALFGSRIAEILPDAITPALAAELRARVASKYTRYSLVDRASYEYAPLDEPALFERLVGIVQERLSMEGASALQVSASGANATRGASARSGASANGAGARAVVEARVLRFAPGDYLLAHADRVHEGNPIEIVIDLSEAAVPGAEVHYRRRGAVFFRVPSVPCSMAIVERGPTVTCNHTYLSKRWTSNVVRLVALVR